MEPTTEKQLSSLTREVFLREASTVRHCQREAHHLGRNAPAEALLAIASHAESTLGALRLACARDQLRASLDRNVAGSVFSELRDQVAELLAQSEHSYRATLVGIRHGVDMMRVVSLSAGAVSKVALAELCSAWLTTRTVLLERAETELLWFAQNPEKGADQHWLGERYGRLEQGLALHPWTKETGLKGASNVGQDETSGSE